MRSIPLMTAFSILFSVSQAASTSPSVRSRLWRRNTYAVFGGDGTTAAGWPRQSDWMSFESLWELNEATINSACTQFGQANNSPPETAAVKSGLESASESSGIPKELLLAIMIQESKGCVRAPTTPTHGGIRNAGLMQDFNGEATCNQGGSAKNPCPKETIAQMIMEGAGVNMKFGVMQAIQQSNAIDAGKYYQGARIYNSGSLDPTGNLGKGYGTPCYASDITNRLIGWNGDVTPCDSNTIGQKKVSEKFVAGAIPGASRRA
ncbi:hypothetical protein BCR34DRAFT_564001 [Clohesyomyces aquaticus]|uniref:Lysozyme-like domain-containing protein n=1 Tax=Clohesyomyces aquaticus TaxID=1231657 RepID=A0A1Y1ZQA5_9PLEO|nr:hypothetical protein BCR34DRAFT_564001 [Clohesyomyces aquaticus]